MYLTVILSCDLSIRPWNPPIDDSNEQRLRSQLFHGSSERPPTPRPALETKYHPLAAVSFAAETRLLFQRTMPFATLVALLRLCLGYIEHAKQQSHALRGSSVLHGGTVSGVESNTNVKNC